MTSQVNCFLEKEMIPPKWYWWFGNIGKYTWLNSEYKYFIRIFNFVIEWRKRE